MTRPWLIPLLLLASWLPACSAHIARVVETDDGARVERILYDPGGAVRKGSEKWAERQRRHQIDRYVIDGFCGSLCVHLALAQESVCYTDNAALWMHPALIAGLAETPQTRRWTEWSVSRWPAAWQRWWNENDPGALGVHLSANDMRKIAPEMECRE